MATFLNGHKKSHGVGGYASAAQNLTVLDQQPVILSRWWANKTRRPNIRCSITASAPRPEPIRRHGH